MSGDEGYPKVECYDDGKPGEQPKIRFKVYEYMGGEVKCLPDLPGDDPLNMGLWPADFIPRPITDPDGLRPGRWVSIWGRPAQVEKRQYGPGEDDWEPQLRSGGCVGWVHFGGDDRKCWVCDGMSSLGAAEIKRLEICR